MKKLLLLSMLLVITSGVCEVVAQKPATNPSRVLFDFRETRPGTRAKIPPQTEKRVLAKVFSKYLTDENQCSDQFDPSGDTDVLQAARNAGQIVPSILDMAEGSFSGRQRSEIAYVISVSECNASHADNFGTKRVAIFDGDRLVADMDVDYKSGIVRKTDLNVDGVDELLMVTGDMNQGTIIEMAALLDFATGKVRVIEDFGTVTEDSCAAGSPDSSSRASRLSMTGGGVKKFPRVRIENYESSCRKAKRWRLVSIGKME